jgi:hypothetical protein
MNKKVYTKIFLSQLDKDASDISVSEYMPLWWQNTREKEEGGLRLTESGFDVVNSLIATYEIPFPTDMKLTTQVIIFLDKFIDCPYFITKQSIFVTNERKAVELTLFSGDMRKYGIAKALRKTKKDENSG